MPEPIPPPDPIPTPEPESREPKASHLILASAGCIVAFAVIVVIAWAIWGLLGL